MAAKPIKAVVKVNVMAGEAAPGASLAQALGPHGIQIMDFCKAYNEKTSDQKGQMAPAVITIYEDRTFDFVVKKSPVSEMIKKALKVEKGSGESPKKIIGTLSKDQVREIAENKMSDLNTENIEAAMKIVEGTARSMGVKIEN